MNQMRFESNLSRKGRIETWFGVIPPERTLYLELFVSNGVELRTKI